MGITKTEFVCHFFEGLDHAISNIAVFAYREEDTGFASRTVVIPRKQWNDLGCPEMITVTIEPGDRLNEETNVRTS